VKGIGRSRKLVKLTATELVELHLFLTLLQLDSSYSVSANRIVIIFFSTEAVLAASITGTIWLGVTILLRFILPEFIQFVLSTGIGAIFVILPIVNHVRIFFFLRRHNKQVHNAVSGQNLSAIFRREKKAAIDMFIVIAVLMLCLAPAVVSSIFEDALGEHYSAVYLWTTTLLFINSSMNPVIYLARNSEIRNAVRGVLCF